MSGQSEPGQTKCAFVALVGAPNAGKSTLLNAHVGARVSIVTHKVQTTRSQIRGIKIVGDTQLVFIDTPGIFAPRRRLDRAMVEAAWSGAGDADIVVVLVDAVRAAANLARGTADSDVVRIIAGLSKQHARSPRAKFVLALNKSDQIDPPKLLPVAKALTDSGIFDETFMISALRGNGVDALQDYLVRTAPAGIWHYDEDQLSDLPERMLAAEITREKAFELLHQELPYALAVETADWQDHRNGDVRIEQVIHIERESQKGMVVGKGGATVKRIRERAQASISGILGRKVHLFLRVKVSPRWADEPDRYRDLGLNFDA